jgi:hypothetical protein
MFIFIAFFQLKFLLLLLDIYIYFLNLHSIYPITAIKLYVLILS